MLRIVIVCRLVCGAWAISTADMRGSLWPLLVSGAVTDYGPDVHVQVKGALICMSDQV